MRSGRWLGLFAVGLACAVLAAVWVRAPGYMDADYYFATAREIAAGNGFTEPFVWNYLANPSVPPNPSHLYWMPLTSIVSAGPLVILGDSFRAAQIPVLLLAAFLPILTARLALFLGLSSRGAWFAGLLAAFSGFYLPFLVTTDSFALYALIGGTALWAMAVASEKNRGGGWLAAGILTAMAHMTRVDGFLLLVPGMVAVMWSRKNRITALGLLVGGYLLGMAAWWARNLLTVGSLMPPGSSRVLWLTEYDDLFSFPADVLTPARWWQSGLADLLQVRWQALVANVKTLVGVNGLIFLAPLMVWGASSLWRRRLVRLMSVYLVLLLASLSLAFPFAGARGGYLHSSIALMPILWALAAEGLERAVSWACGIRGWRFEEAIRGFRILTVLLVAAMSVGLLWYRVVGSDASNPKWGASQQVYREAGHRLGGVDPQVGLVAVNNPPGFYLATGLPAVVIPNGTSEDMRAVGERFDVEWVVLEANHPKGLESLYQDPSSESWLELVEEFADGGGSKVYILKATYGEGAR